MTFCKRVLLLAMTLLWAGRAQAATVAILQPSADSAELGEAVFRVKGELLAVGLAVAILERPPSTETRSAEAQEWFERTAALRGLDAFVDVVGDRTLLAVDVWLWSGSPQRLTLSRVALEPGATPATAAIRTIEVLRSNFLILDLPPPEKPAERPAPLEPKEAPDAARVPAKSQADFGVAAGAAALTSLNGVGPSVLPLARVEWFARPWLSLQATAAGFGTRPRVEAEAGSAEVDQRFALLGLCACRSSSGVAPAFSLATGVMHTALDGRAEPPNVAHRVDQLALLVDASAGLRFGLTRPYYLALELHAQLAEPYVAVHVADSVVATTGQPNLLLSLTLGAGL